MGNIIALMYLFLLGTFFLALAGLDAGSAFGGMGSSREVAIAALAEPTVLIAIFGIALRAGTTSLDGMITRFAAEPLLMLNAGHLLAFFAFFIVALAENGRLPVDNPATHLELTMIHEAMILEYSGRLSCAGGMGGRDEVVFVPDVVVESVFPLGCCAHKHAERAHDRFSCARAEAPAFRRGHRALGNLGRQATPVPRTRAFGRIVHSCVIGRSDFLFSEMTGVAMSPEVLSKLVNLLSFAALGLTVLLIIRIRSGRTSARVRLTVVRTRIALRADRALQR